MNQNEMILGHLKTQGAITPLEALNKYGCFRLASRISELRQAGYPIYTDMIKRNGKHYAKYVL